MNNNNLCVTVFSYKNSNLILNDKKLEYNGNLKEIAEGLWEKFGLKLIIDNKPNGDYLINNNIVGYWICISLCEEGQYLKYIKMKNDNCETYKPFFMKELNDEYILTSDKLKIFW